MSEVDHASNWDRLIFALELAVNSKINMELTTSQCKYLLDKLTSLTDRVADLEAERRWIPVSAGLLPDPDEQELVLCYAPNFASTEIRWTDEIGEAITHWMPLPLPPEDK